MNAKAIRVLAGHRRFADFLVRCALVFLVAAALSVPARAQYMTGYPAGQIPGTTTNDNANAGNVGQYLEAKQTSVQSCPSTTVQGDIGSLALTAGDWDLSFVGNQNANGATVQQFGIGFGTVSGNNTTGMVTGDSAVFVAGSTSSNNTAASIPNFRVSLASPTTYYCKVSCNYSAGTPQYVGRCSARRVR